MVLLVNDPNCRYQEFKNDEAAMESSWPGENRTAGRPAKPAAFIVQVGPVGPTEFISIFSIGCHRSLHPVTPVAFEAM